EPCEDVPALVERELRPVRARLHVRLEPHASLLVGDPEVLDTQVSRVRLRERAKKPGEWATLAAAERRPRDLAGCTVAPVGCTVAPAVAIRLAEPPLIEPEKRMLPRALTERIQIRDQVAELAVAMDEIGDLRVGREPIVCATIRSGPVLARQV